MSFIGSIYIFISIMQFGFRYYDLSQLVSNMAIGFSFFILAYIYFYFRHNDTVIEEMKKDNKNKIEEINKDFQSYNNRLNDLENKFIEFKNKEK